MRLEGLDGRVVLVTGAGGGIGQRVVETLSAMGARTAGCDLLTSDIPGNLAIQMDVTDSDSVERGFAQIESEL
jgi:3-oxoacyl-[acyl-carrier protein] reductase